VIHGDRDACAGGRDLSLVDPTPRQSDPSPQLQSERREPGGFAKRSSGYIARMWRRKRRPSLTWPERAVLAVVYVAVALIFIFWSAKAAAILLLAVGVIWWILQEYGYVRGGPTDPTTRSD
jgi:hypothetical protein